jgi:protein-disulfide isomerase
VNPDGVITVGAGSASRGSASGGRTSHGSESQSTAIDVYEDALCPFCGRFEQQYGGKIVDAVNAGELTVHYRMVTFLDAGSPSGDYSTRALAAMLTLARTAGERPGLVLAFHRALFDPSVQPEERGSKDLSNDQLAALAGQLGAPKKALSAIAAGADVPRARAAATANLAALKKASPRPGTPTVIHAEHVVDLAPGWLQKVLGD